MVQGMARGVRSPEGQQAALELLQALGEGYRLLCLYRRVSLVSLTVCCWPTRPSSRSAYLAEHP